MMSAHIDKFRYSSYAQEVIFGPGSISLLNEVMNRFHGKRFMLCASRSIRSSGQIALLETTIGERLVAIYDQVQPHVQDIQVAEAFQIASENRVEAVIGLGGGSPIGMGKAVGSQLRLPVIAIPTTYAGSEMTPVYGITHTDESPPRKVTVNNPKVTPSLVIYDAELTLGLPSSVTASTGINALAHCIEALYSITRNPLSTAAAVEGVRLIHKALFNCFRDGNNLAMRTEMLLGSHLAGFSLASVSMGLHHGICHVLGGTANVPHGIANSIILPYAIRFNADATALRLIPAAEAMEISSDGSNPTRVIEAMVEQIYQLIRSMDLPQRLRDAGVAQSDLQRLAELAFQNRTVQNNPKRITDVAQLERLLRDAW